MCTRIEMDKIMMIFKFMSSPWIMEWNEIPLSNFWSSLGEIFDYWEVGPTFQDVRIDSDG